MDAFEGGGREGMRQGGKGEEEVVDICSRDEFGRDLVVSSMPTSITCVSATLSS